MNYPAASRRSIKRNTFPKRPKGRGTDPSADGELGAAYKTLEIPRLHFGIAQCERSGSVQLNIFTALSFVKYSLTDLIPVVSLKQLSAANRRYEYYIFSVNLFILS